MLRFTCPQCGKKLKMDELHAGRKAKCPRCGRRFAAPRASANSPCLAGDEAGVSTPCWNSIPDAAADDTVLDVIPAPSNAPIQGSQAASPDDAIDVLPASPADNKPARENPGCFQPRRLSRLVPCSACGRDIAKNAVSCPGCGAPNNYLHPEIARFQRNLRRFKNLGALRYQAEHDVLMGWAEGIGGQLAGAASSWIGSLGFISWQGGVKGLAGLAKASLYQWASVEILNALRSHGKKAFVVDFGYLPPQWRSSDDEYWRSIKVFFRLQSDRRRGRSAK